MSAADLALRFHQRAAYFSLRASNPEIPARLLWGYTTSDGGEPLAEFVCARTTGHDWTFTGTAYGGDDERWHGEGRCLCARCGADGDA